MSTPGKTATSNQTPDHPAFVVPRVWLTALTILVIVPWLVAGTLYLWRPGETATPAAGLAELPSKTTRASDPWGTLLITPIVISPPIELIADDWARLPDAGKYWFFPGTGLDVAGAFLSSTGLTQAQVSRLLSTARSEPSISGVVMTPDADLLRGLAPEVRARLYVQLGKSQLNADQLHAFRFASGSSDDWLRSSLISPATRRLVEPLIYRYGQHMYFADAALVRSTITDVQERRRLVKTLLRQSTVRVRLSIQNNSDLGRLDAYWGRGGRRTDIRPILESIVGEGVDHSLDIVHLLPVFARERLYRYPEVTAQDLDRPLLANCLWTALNFFNQIPDDRYLDVGFAVEHMKRDYFVVENNFELGDIVALLDERGNLIHTATYIADGLVFTKNGTSRVAPWVILPIDMLVDYYRPHSEKPGLIYHRRKDL
ncbi:MAG: hypothetical protein NTV05_05595 [Acidobacteria bacterium]|nr:hypothetical protein [Acidobacteriota bacterium]